jgi:membrane-associated phospholipid phosphatase
LVAQAWWSVRLVRWPMLVWNGLIIATAITMGGHYFADLFAGAALWRFATWVTSAPETSRKQGDVLATT